MRAGLCTSLFSYAERPQAATSNVELFVRQPQKLPRIGFVGPSTAVVDRPLIAPFVQRLAELGWLEGRSIVVEYRAAEGSAERAGEIAAEFVRGNVDLIVTGGDARSLSRAFHRPN